VITRQMVTLGARCNNGKMWVTMKNGGARIGVIMPDKRHGGFCWRELGFNTKPGRAMTKSDAVGRLLISLNGGK
jgi:hypothetical protein